MQRFADTFIAIFKKVLPSPFTIAAGLTAVAFCIAFFSTGKELAVGERSLFLLDVWEKGLWNAPLLVFAFQMMLMLVLGHVLALTPLAERLVNRLSHMIGDSTAKAAFFVTLFTMMVGLFNWGFGLIFGAILARKVGEHASRVKLNLNYALIGAAGYAGLMVWHGGLSGSSLLKVAEPGHLHELMQGVLSISQMETLPTAVSPSETLFSTMNIVCVLLLLSIVPTAMWLLGKKVESAPIQIKTIESMSKVDRSFEGAEKLDVVKWPSILLGLLMIAMAVWRAWDHPAPLTFQWITPNWINLVLFGAALTAHASIRSFLTALENAIGGAAGILIQFPLYFGIMGLITGSGLVTDFSDFMVSVSTPSTYPVFTFFSAGLVNIFVPSGGGQWAVQGAIIVKAATELGLPLGKSIMALAYGDQITNMLQPFWALPLLGITGLKARDILPYTLFMMLLGSIIFISVLLIF